MDPNALLSHILLQTRQNVEFLVAQKQLTHEAGQDILHKIPSNPVNVGSRNDPNAPVALDHGVSDLVRRTSTLSVSQPTAAAAATSTIHTIPASGSLPTPAYSAVSSTTSLPGPHVAYSPPIVFEAKALWDYSQDPADLSFRAGDIIHVTAETNADWWTGFVRDDPSKMQGLFPSNYVERIPGPPPTNPSSPSNPPYPHPPQTQYQHEKAPGYGGYQPYQSPSGPPPQHGGYSSYTPPQGQPGGGYYQPPPPVGTVGPPVDQSQPSAEQPPKKKFGGKFGNTLAQSAVGGLGFGAGSAVGSGIVNSIF